MSKVRHSVTVKNPCIRHMVTGADIVSHQMSHERPLKEVMKAEGHLLENFRNIIGGATDENYTDR